MTFNNPAWEELKEVLNRELEAERALITHLSHRNREVDLLRAEERCKTIKKVIRKIRELEEYDGV